MRGATTTLVLLAIHLGSTAQVLYIDPNVSDPSMLTFNKAFIQRNEVRSITGTASIKRDGQPIKEKGDRTEYRFDPAGQASHVSNTFGRPGSGIDTISVAYTFDARGHVVEELRNDVNGFFAVRDSVDSAGRSLRHKYVRIRNIGPDRYHFEPGQETMISDERSVCSQINDTAWKCTVMNDRGLPYRERIFHRDGWGYLRTIDDRNLITGRSGRTSFRYDEKGRLAERIEQPDLTLGGTHKYIWRYDNAGNVVLCDSWHDDRQYRHMEYLYEEGTMLLKATISKEMETGLIHIVRYTTDRR